MTTEIATAQNTDPWRANTLEERLQLLRQQLETAEETITFTENETGEGAPDFMLRERSDLAHQLEKWSPRSAFTSQVWTTAPPDYDGFNSITIEMTDFFTEGGKQVRKALVDNDYLTWQSMRYQSGSHMAVNHVDFAEQIKYGLVKKRPTS